MGEPRVSLEKHLDRILAEREKLSVERHESIRETIVATASASDKAVNAARYELERRLDGIATTVRTLVWATTILFVGVIVGTAVAVITVLLGKH